MCALAFFYNLLPLSARRKPKPQNNMKKILLTLATVLALTAAVEAHHLQPATLKKTRKPYSNT